MSRLALVLAVLPLAVSGCGSGSATSPFPEFGLATTQTRLAEEKWMRVRPLQYRILEVRSCECLSEATAPMWLDVAQVSRIPEEFREGIVSATYEATGQLVPAGYAEYMHTVQGLFEKIRAARAAGAAKVEVEFDPTWGYPRRVFIDHDARMVDDEVFYEIRRFDPGVVALQRSPTELSRGLSRGQTP